MLLKDFEFIEQELDENTIRHTPKYLYSKEIKKESESWCSKVLYPDKKKKTKRRCNILVMTQLLCKNICLGKSLASKKRNCYLHFVLPAIKLE